MAEKLRIGLLNIMPEAEKYEPSVRGLIEGRPLAAETALIRLETHAYKSSDKEHLRENYRSFAERMSQGGLDGLVITGAPVETMEFGDIRYWPELRGIMERARREITSTLGICWGGIAVGGLLGLRRITLPRKLFGVFRADWLAPGHWSCAPGAAGFDCPQSRYAGLDEDSLSHAAGRGEIRLLAGGPGTGHFMFESADGRLAGNLGHPEYTAGRIMFEYLRDQRKGLGLVPEGFDVAAPAGTWAADSQGLFDRWLRMIAGKKAGQK